MKVLFTRFPFESAYGGAEVQTLSLMQGLLSRGHAVAFLGSCPVLLKLCSENGIPAAELNIGKPPVSKWTVLSFFWRKKRMEAVLKESLKEFKDIDTICMLSLSEKILMTEHALKRGKKVFWIEHDRVGSWLTRNPWLNRLLRFAKRVTTICVSDLSRDLYLVMGWPEKQTVSIPNGVAEAKNQYTVRRNGNVLQAGCIARLTKDKGVDILIKALQKVPSMYLTILGRGREKKRLRTKARMLDVQNRVTFIDDIERIDDFFQNLDLFILPSRQNDPFGMAAAEAMMRGIPSIVTNQCGIARHIKANEEVIVVRAGSVDSLQDGMRVLTDSEMRQKLSEAGYRAALERFTLKTMIDRYEQLLS